MHAGLAECAEIGDSGYLEDSPYIAARTALRCTQEPTPSNRIVDERKGVPVAPSDDCVSDMCFELYSGHSKTWYTDNTFKIRTGGVDVRHNVERKSKVVSPAGYTSNVLG